MFGIACAYYALLLPCLKALAAYALYSDFRTECYRWLAAPLAQLTTQLTVLMVPRRVRGVGALYLGIRVD
jgi:hypothetical protein